MANFEITPLKIGVEKYLICFGTVRAHAFTESARAAIEAAGGSCVVLSRTKDIPLEQAIAEKAEIAAAQEIKRKELRALKASRLSSV